MYWYASTRIYDRVIKQLSKDGILNSWAVKEVVRKLHKNVLGNNFGVTATSSAFTIDVDAIKIKEEYKKTMLENKTHKFLDRDIVTYKELFELIFFILAMVFLIIPK